MDVTPLSLGIETLGGVMTKLIEANTTIPTSKAEVFSTAADNQPSVEIHVLQGERTRAVDNRTLGRFHLDGIMSAPRGVPQIEVKFDIDANGVLNVSATDKATSKEQKIRIESSSGLSESEIEKMRKDAQAHADEDKKLKERIDKLNAADAMIFSTKKQLDEHKDKLSDTNKEKIGAALAKVEELHKAENIDELDAAIEALNQAWAAASTEMYEQAGKAAEGGTGEAGPDMGGSAGGDAADKDQGPAKGSDAIDAEYEVVDDDDKK
jgi:molecular chaperone DnaK